MTKYNIDSVSTLGSVQFSYKSLPVLFFVTLAQLGIMVEFTGSKIRPYTIKLSESEFMSAVELSEGA